MAKPQVFGRYLLLDKVASGGMAEVWRAKLSGEAGFQRIIAIKKILPHVAEDQEFISMFTDEANITSRLQHANIGQVYEFSKIGDTFYIAMEYISGKDLKTVWSYNRSRKSTMPLDLAAFIVARMADGLDYAHRLTDNFGQDAGIVHRDVSPQNVLLSWDGEVKVIDFGIAKAQEKSGRTRPGTLKGKFAYMSPEQIRGLNLDGRADIFALGVVLYEMCTGERGFSAESEFSLLEMVRNVEIKPPTIVNRDIPAELERIIYKALAKDREHRYQTGAELSEELQRFLIMKGKPPSRQEISRYLKENFTVDFEKERARLESYKEISLDDVEPASASGSSSRQTGTHAPVPSEQDNHDDGTAAWSQEDDAFASSKPPVRPAPPSGGIRPQARAVVPVAVDTIANKTPANVRRPSPPGFVASPSTVVPPSAAKGPKLFVAAAAATLVIAAAAVAAWIFILPKPSGTIVVTVTGAPAAVVRLDDRTPSRAEPSITLETVPHGPHALIVEEPGYQSYSKTIVTSADQPLLSIKAQLMRLPGKLVVGSEPPGASVFLDGKDTGLKAPATIEVEGETLHEIALRLEGYREVRKSDVKVPVSAELPVRLTLTPEKIRIRVTSVPEGALVRIAGANLGNTPVVLERGPEDAPPVVELSAKGCKTYKTSIPLELKLEMHYPITLECR
ncbi:MAG: protein kinase [Deltaproteobacteria bacterium]|nr:protein kinase [Deltaproteobacteria bacterium]